MSLDEVYDATEDASAELLRRGVDVRAYVVLVYGHHARVYPAIVGAPPFSKEEYGRRFKRRVVRGHALSPHDYSDVCYLTFSVWGHDHPPCVNVFPFKGTLPEDVLGKMKREGAEFFGGTGEQ